MATQTSILQLTKVASLDDVDAGSALNDNFDILDAAAGQVFNVQYPAYGAAGDGVTDDTSAIQSALDAAGTYAASNGGAIVVIPPAKYLIAAGTRLNVHSNTVIWAYGAYIFKGGIPSIGLLCNFVSGDSFAGYTGNSHIRVFGGTWDAKGQNAAASAGYDTIDFNHCADILCKDMVIRNGCSDHALEFNSTNGGMAVNCRFEGFVDQTGGSRTFSEAVQIDCAESGSSTIGPFDGTHAKNILIQGCYMGPAVDGSGLGSFGKLAGSHTTASGTSYQNISIIGNICDGSLDNGIQAYNWDDSLICNNIITGAGANGIMVTVPDPGTVGFSVLSQGVVVSGNTIDSPTNAGIDAFGYSATAGVSDLNISGNIVRNAGTNGIVATIVTAPLSVQDNIVDTSASNGISINGCPLTLVSGNYVTSPASNYCIFLGASGSFNSTDCQVSGNFAINGFTAGIRLSTGCTLCSVTGNTVRKGAHAAAIAVSCSGGTGSVNVVTQNDLSGFGSNTSTITVSTGTVSKTIANDTNVGTNSF